MSDKIEGVSMSDTNSKDWIADLVKAVEARKKHIEKVEAEAPEVLSKLKAAVRRDADRLNDELYKGHKILRFGPGGEYDFTVMHLGTDAETEVIFKVEDDLLECTFKPDYETLILRTTVGSSGLSFFESNNLVEVDELSRKLIEPLIKAEFKLR
jgi:hypothetical protein